MRNHVVINIGRRDFWLSLVSIDYGEESTNEIALVRKSDASFMGVHLIPPAYWLSPNLPDNGGVVSLTCRDSDEWGDMNEGEVLSVIITKAIEYISSYPKES